MKKIFIIFLSLVILGLIGPKNISAQSCDNVGDSCCANLAQMSQYCNNSLKCVAGKCAVDNNNNIQINGLPANNAGSGCYPGSDAASNQADNLCRTKAGHTLCNDQQTQRVFCCDAGISCPANAINNPAGLPGNLNNNSGGSASTNGSTINGNCGPSAIDTAIGCIPFGTQNDLITFFIRWGVGIGGGIAFLLIIVAGFQIMTSRGDPKRLQAGQELMTSAIAGLLMLIFSVVILRIIGVDILKIPGF